MNAATKILDRHRAYKKRVLFNIEFNLRTIVLLTAVLLSAFTLVYVKDLNRRLFVRYQQLQVEHNQLYINWSKLLLEQITLSTQARIAHVAKTRLQMTMPKSIKLISTD